MKLQTRDVQKTHLVEIHAAVENGERKMLSELMPLKRRAFILVSVEKNGFFWP